MPILGRHSLRRPASHTWRGWRRASRRWSSALWRAHLRDVLGDQIYDSLAHEGATMTTADMATYAYDQIDQARAELNAVSK